VEGDPKDAAVRSHGALVKAGLPGGVLSCITFARAAESLGADLLKFKAARAHGDFYDYTNMGGHAFEAYSWIE
jgi:hypothetical protein